MQYLVKLATLVIIIWVSKNINRVSIQYSIGSQTSVPTKHCQHRIFIKGHFIVTFELEADHIQAAPGSIIESTDLYASHFLFYSISTTDVRQTLNNLEIYLF